MNTQRTYLWLGLWAGGLLLLLSVIALISPLQLQSTDAESQAYKNPDRVYRLQTAITDGRMVFVGDSADIDGVTNPPLSANKGEVVRIRLKNGDGGTHDVAVPAFGARAERILRTGNIVSVTFQIDREGNYPYFCTVSGHRTAGMEGWFNVGSAPEQRAVNAQSISRDPEDLPGPVKGRDAKTVRYDLTAVELKGKLGERSSYTYYTFNGKVPGPMLRVRVNDQVEVSLVNPDSNTMVHSIDFHAATGPGGGAAVMQVPPGEEKTFTFKALKPGLYVYHCASPMVSQHIANGMYGMILVEPEKGLSPVDHEFYIMQQELYTDEAMRRAEGHLEFSGKKLLNEQAEYVVLNGAVGALTQQYPLEVEVGETARIYFGVGGPNYTSSFHIIGEILDMVYPAGSFASPPLRDIQTTSVAPGGATVAELSFDVPGTYKIVDHALARMERGLIGYIRAIGSGNAEIFHEGSASPVM